MIEVRDWNKSFGKNHVLRGINCKIETGEVVVMLGASGSGKSTFLRSLNFLEQAEQGTLILDDLTLDMKHVTKKDIIKVRRNTAMVFQAYNLFRHKTALENVMEALVVVQNMSKCDAREIAEEELIRVGLADRMNYFPHQMSGGQQQRVGIARALAIKPKVILFDEPTSSLDPEMIGEVLDVIRSISHKGITLIIVTHEMDFAKDCADRVIFLADGNIYEESTPEEFFTNPKKEKTQKFLQRIINR
ncbi:MAG: amino acid ABC transporter ATP-binding protein [Clostridiaceae bacterium]|nr:amino acid ABC transporter ATP-binding protein [Clostridiaceae bacterium]